MKKEKFLLMLLLVSCMVFISFLTYASDIPRALRLEDVKDRLPAIRNQVPYGNCWAHSVIGTMETSLIWK